MSRKIDSSDGGDSEQSCPAAASIPDEAGPLVALSELDSCDLISGPHSAHRQPRQARKRGDDGKLLMSWRVPEWTLPPLTSDLRLSSQEPLEQLESRTQCPGCGKSQHYFCFNCLRAFTPPHSTPRVALPFHAHMIFHRTERASMSTGVHAAVLAPAHVTLHRWPDVHARRLPQFHARDTVVLFPSAKAREVGEMSAEERRRVKRVVLLEGKWKGASALLALPQLASLPHVRLPSSIRSAFWRYHTRGVAPDAVSTVEALLWLCRCWHAGSYVGNSQGIGCEVEGRMVCGGDERRGDGREKGSGGVWEKGEQMEEERGRVEMEGGVGVRCGQEGGGERQGRALDVKGRGEANDEGDEGRQRDTAEEIPDRTMPDRDSRNGVHGEAATLQRVANGGAEEPMGGEEPAASLQEQGECSAMRGAHASDCHCFDDLLWFFAHYHRRIMHEGSDLFT
ncbi:unnamed protein product [Closterium sp. Naga37s-1]|nr:unnamed protein product [Closterium sp. Naga37s-1]